MVTLPSQKQKQHEEAPVVSEWRCPHCQILHRGFHKRACRNRDCPKFGVDVDAEKKVKSKTRPKS